MGDNSHKRRTFQDNFIKHWCCSSHNHPEGWRWWKKRTRKLNRIKLKEDLRKEE